MYHRVPVASVDGIDILSDFVRALPITVEQK